MRQQHLELGLAIVPLALAVYFGVQLAMLDGEAHTAALDWVPALGVELAFRLDGLSLLFALLISGIGALVFVYSVSYMHGSAVRGRFYALLYLFMGSMLGVVLSDDLISLFVFWELTSLTSFGLIGLESQRAESRAAATQALFVTSGGGLAMLAGFVLLAQDAGTYRISELIEAGAITESGVYLPILVLVLLGAFTKSAQTPFHFWLPNAMEAPTPVSAYLHSATMVKAGVYLIARLTPVLGGSDEWYYGVSTVGALTMLTGAVLAMAQTDLKRILAYSTVAILGSLVFLLGIGTEEAVLGAIILLVAHAAYKATLFLCAGILDHGTGTRDIREMGGLLRAMPVTAACVLIAGLSMAGIAPFAGFIAKEAVYESLLHAERHAVLVTVATVLANALLVAVALLLFVRPFLGPLRRPGHEGDALLLAGPVVLCVLTVLISLAPGTVDSALVTTPASEVLPQEAASLSLWHGITLALALSALTILLGVLAFHAREHLTLRLRSNRFAALSPERLYEAGMTGLASGAELLTRSLQAGYLRRYFTVILAATVGVIAATAAFKTTPALPDFSPSPRLEEVGVAAITVAGALLALTTNSRIIAIIALGIVGYGVALVYALLGAPDLAITQILVETLIVLLMIFAFYRLPRYASYSNVPTRLRDGLLAVAGGATVSILLLTTLTVDQDRDLSQSLAALSKPEAFGSNVVNVILVDFRALDTLGEITVLAAAAIGIVSLLRATSRWGE